MWSRLRPALRRLLAAIGGSIGVDDVLLVIGVALLAYGAGLIYQPAGYLVPGAVLVWIALPPKPFPIIFRTTGKDT